MKPDLPPRLDSEPSKRRSLGPLWAVGLIALALIVAHLVELWQVPLPQCTTRSLTGLPCPFCGSTRTMMAAARGDFVRAAALNPLMFMGLVVLLAWFGVWADRPPIARDHWSATTAHSLGLGHRRGDHYQLDLPLANAALKPPGRTHSRRRPPLNPSSGYRTATDPPRPSRCPRCRGLPPCP